MVVLKEATWLFIFSRVLIVFVSYIGISRFPFEGTHAVPNGNFECSVYLRQCLMAWERKDVFHYISIASRGYTDSWRTAFFPLFPFLMRLVGRIGGGSDTDFYFAGLLVANVCFFLAMIVFFRLIEEEFGPTIARSSLFFLTFAPLGVFFFVGYTESLFLLFAVLVFYCLKKASKGESPLWWLAAGLSGYFAALTRATGILLGAPIFIVAVFYCWKVWKEKTLKQNWLRIASSILSMALVLAGLLTYMVYLWIRWGQPLLFRAAEEAGWQRHSDLPWTALFNDIHDILLYSPFTSRYVLDILMTVFPVIAIIIGWRRLPLHYAIFSLLVAFFSLSNPAGTIPHMDSMPRYMLAIFTVPVLFAIWSKNPRIEKILITSSLIFFCIHLLFFVTWRWAG